MRTTLILDDALFRELKKRAAQEQRTLTEVTQEALRLGLERRDVAQRGRRTKLPSFAMGRPLVDVADRDRLQEALDGS